MHAPRDVPGPRDSDNPHTDNVRARADWPWPADIGTKVHLETPVTNPVLDPEPDPARTNVESRETVHPEVAIVVAPPGASPPPASATAICPAVGRIIGSAGTHSHLNR
jgi:hypothetical protein